MLCTNADPSAIRRNGRIGRVLLPTVCNAIAVIQGRHCVLDRLHLCWEEGDLFQVFCRGCKDMETRDFNKYMGLYGIVIIGCLALFLVILVAVCSVFAVMGFLPKVVVYPAFGVTLVFSVVLAHVIIICNVATVISVLEDVLGPQALLRSVFLIRGQTHVGLLIYLGSTIGMAFVEGLFHNRVKTLSYGDGSSRIWEGPSLVIMYSFVVLIDSMMSAVFYFTCRSSLSWFL